MLNYQKLETGIFLVKSNSSVGPKSNGILIKNGEKSGDILIDGNFSKNEIKRLNIDLNAEINTFFVSHTHLDHVSNLHFYENPSIKIFCPVPEDRYLKNMNIFLKENGMVDFGVDNIFRELIYEEFEFKNLTHVHEFKPGTKFTYNRNIIETIHIPGHSPGHTAYLIRDNSEVRRAILFVSDIGIERSGPWYGLSHCSLEDVRISIRKMENVYLGNNNGDIILTSAHGTAYFTKQPEIFKKALKRIDGNEEKVLQSFNYDYPLGLKDVIFKGVYYPEKHIARLSPSVKKIHFFWEWNIILHHVNELIEKGKLVEKSEDPSTYLCSSE